MLYERLSAVAMSRAVAYERLSAVAVSRAIACCMSVCQLWRCPELLHAV